MDSTFEKLGVKTTGIKERFSRELMAIKPVVNGRYSSLAKFFPNLLFNNSFNVSIAKIKPFLRSFGEGGGGVQIFAGMRYSPSSHTV